jgi:hypothetical protein
MKGMANITNCHVLHEDGNLSVRGGFIFVNLGVIATLSDVTSPLPETTDISALADTTVDSSAGGFAFIMGDFIAIRLSVTARADQRGLSLVFPWFFMFPTFVAFPI